MGLFGISMQFLSRMGGIGLLERLSGWMVQEHRCERLVNNSELRMKIQTEGSETGRGSFSDLSIAECKL